MVFAKKAQLLDDFRFIAECNVGGEDLPPTRPPPLPAMETVLADKPWQVIPRDEGIDNTYAELGFKVTVPKRLYNQG